MYFKFTEDIYPIIKIMKFVTLAVSSAILGIAVSANCPQNSWWSTSAQQCVCDPGYGKDPNGNCVNTDPAWNNCPKYSTYVAYDQKCVCWNGYKMSGNQCVEITSTSSGSGYGNTGYHQKTCP